MAKKNTAKEKSAKEVSEMTFTCKFCGETKPFSELVLQTRYFPLITSCRDCEKHLSGMRVQEIPAESGEIDAEQTEETKTEE